MRTTKLASMQPSAVGVNEGETMYLNAIVQKEWAGVSFATSEPLAGVVCTGEWSTMALFIIIALAFAITALSLIRPEWVDPLAMYCKLWPPPKPSEPVMTMTGGTAKEAASLKETASAWQPPLKNGAEASAPCMVS